MLFTLILVLFLTNMSNYGSYIRGYILKSGSNIGGFRKLY